jgi:hypothetical protein
MVQIYLGWREGNCSKGDQDACRVIFKDDDNSEEAAEQLLAPGLLFK